MTQVITPRPSLFWGTALPGENGAMTDSLLVVEDDETIRETIRDALLLEGYAVTACGDGREALDTLRQASMGQRFALVVCLLYTSDAADE